MAEFDCCIIVDDDDDILVAARLALRGLFRELVTLSSPERAITAAAKRSTDVILLDANIARGATDAQEGLALLDQLLAADPEAIIVMITAHAGVGIAVEAMKHGATDFVSKPWDNERLVQTVRTAAALRRSRRAAASAGVVAQAGGAPLIGSAPSMARVHSLIARAAPAGAFRAVAQRTDGPRDHDRRGRARPQPRPGRAAAGRGSAQEARLQHIRRRARARPVACRSLSPDGEAWALIRDSR